MRSPPSRRLRYPRDARCAAGFDVHFSGYINVSGKTCKFSISLPTRRDQAGKRSRQEFTSSSALQFDACVFLTRALYRSGRKYAGCYRQVCPEFGDSYERGERV